MPVKRADASSLPPPPLPLNSLFMQKSFKQERREVYERSAVNAAVTQGLQAAAAVAACGGVASFFMNRYWQRYRTSLGVSGKLGTVVMAVFGTFILTSEQTLHGETRRHLGLDLEQTIGQRDEEPRSTPAAESVIGRQSPIADYFIENPFKCMFGCTGIAMTGIAARIWATTPAAIGESPATTLGRRVMQTRVLTQGVLLAAAVTTMATHQFLLNLRAEAHAADVARERQDEKKGAGADSVVKA